MSLLLLLACAGTNDHAADDTGPADTAETGPPGGCPTAGNGDLDIANQCVGDLCLPAPYLDVEDALGHPATCTTAGTTSNCFWPSIGIDWTFTDCDGDGDPDEDTSACDMFEQEAGLSVPYLGTTADGLGLGVARECWEYALGAGVIEDEREQWRFDATAITRSLTVTFPDDKAGHLYLFWRMDE